MGRSGITPGTGDSVGSHVGLVAISAAFPSADADHGINGSFEDGLSSLERKLPVRTPSGVSPWFSARVLSQER